MSPCLPPKADINLTHIFTGILFVELYDDDYDDDNHDYVTKRPKPHQSHCLAQADNRPALTPDKIIAIFVTIVVTPDKIVAIIVTKDKLL